MEILLWLESSSLGIWVAESWGYPIVLSSHAVGMAIVVGTAVMIDLRLLGFAREVPLSLFSELSIIAWIGLLLNVLSGLALFCGDPTKFFYHPIFWAKIILIILGAVSIWWALGITKGHEGKMDKVEKSTKVTVIAACSLLFWINVIVAGRLIAYMEFN